MDDLDLITLLCDPDAVLTVAEAERLARNPAQNDPGDGRYGRVSAARMTAGTIEPLGIPARGASGTVARPASSSFDSPIPLSRDDNARG